MAADLAPADPDSAEICLDNRCVTATDSQLLVKAAEAVNRAQRVRPGDDCSNQGRTDNVDRTYLVRFAAVGRTAPEIEVPLGCAPIRAPDAYDEYALNSGGADIVRIAYDQQISPETQYLGIGDRGRLSPQVLHAYATGHAKLRPSTASEPMKATTITPGAGLRIGVSPVPGAQGNTRTISARAA